jgi:hypothetical protein
MRGGAGTTLLVFPTLATLAAFAAIAAPACKRSQTTPQAPPPKPSLGSIAVDNRAPARPELAPSRRAEDLDVDEQVLEAAVRKSLLASGLFAAPRVDAGAAPIARARLVFAAECVEVGPKGEAHAQVRIRVDTRPSDAPGAVAFDVEGQGVEPYAVPPAPAPAKGRGAPAAQPDRKTPSLTALVTRITSDLIAGVGARRRLQEGSPSALHAALVADGGELREEAIRIVGERQIREEVPTLLKLLSADEEPLRDAALGALIAMRERSAVRELTQSRSLRDRREMRKIIEAISVIGGQEADEYLSFVAATHDDDEIRTEAAAARARLQRREAEAGATGR